MPYKIRILPRWLVFLLDLFLVCFCVFLSRLLKMNFNLDHVSKGLYFMLSFVLGINAVLFYIFKSYAGIVRFTNLEDTSRLVMVNAIAAFFYLVLNTFYLNSGNYFTLQVVTINFFISSFVIVSYRLAVRYCFNFYKSIAQGGDKIEKKNVAVLGASADGQHIAKVLNSLPNGNLEVVAFLDDSFSTAGKQLEGVPIYSTQESSLDKLREDGVELIILANKNIEKKKLNELVDNCLARNIRIQQVPAMNEWLNGMLDTQQLQNINIEDLLEREVIKIYNEAIFQEYRGKNILVTGAAGSIGSELVRQLLNYRPSLIILCDKAETPMHEFVLELKEKFQANNIKAYIGDICDRQRMEHLFEVYNPQIVFHAAAYKHVPLMEENPSVAVINNVYGTRNIAELSVQHSVEKFVMVSTDKAVNPTNVMGASKRIAEIYTQSYFRYLAQHNGADGAAGVTKFVTTRFGNVLGSNGSVIPRFKKQLEKGGPLTVTHPEITRYFMTIPEACLLVIEAGAMGQGGEIFVFDMGKPVKIADLARKVIKLAGKEPDVDIKIVYTGLRPGEKLYEELLSNAENCRPTYHEKIMIADVRQYDFDLVEKRVNKLVASARQHYTMETVYLMKELVPEFISNNSIYEKMNIITQQ